METRNLSLHRTTVMSSTFSASRLGVEKVRIPNVITKFGAKSMSNSSAYCSHRSFGHPSVRCQFGFKDHRIPSERTRNSRAVAGGIAWQTLTTVKGIREAVCLGAEAGRAAAADEFVGRLKEQGFPDQVVNIKMCEKEGFGCASARPLKAGEVALSVPADFFVTAFDDNNHPAVSGPGRGDKDRRRHGILCEALPEGTASPLLLTESERDENTEGFPVLGEVKERVAALEEVYEELSSVFSEKDPQNVVPSEIKGSSAGTLYLVDIHPLCYEGKKPRPRAILKWMKLLFNQVTREDPVIAVMDGEKGNDYRRQLLPGYKARRNKYKPLSGVRGPYYRGDEMDLREAFPLIQDFLTQCNLPVLKLEDAEADDVIATLMHQAVSKGMRVVVASPDMDFRQLLSENVNMLLPLPEFGRWSFYTLEQYVAQNSCDPGLDLGLRCILGDSSDNVPGLPELAPGFGRKTALKLMKKHGSLESLLVAAKTRTVGRPYIQEALTQHADILHRNLQVLKLRRDLDITLKQEWCRRRDRSSEVQAFQMLERNLLRTTVS